MWILRPLYAVVSALVTGSTIHFLSSRINFTPQTKSPTANEESRYERKQVPQTLQFGQCLIDEKKKIHQEEALDKVLDAIFVSHGIEEAPSRDIFEKLENSSRTEAPDVVLLNQENFKDLHDGDWLVLTYFPSASANEFVTYFKEHFSTINGVNLRFALLDASQHALLVAALQVKSYPSLQLVTENGRLREWPFALGKLDQESLSFIIHGHWKHMPVYQKLRPIREDQENFALAFTAFQIEAFNFVTKHKNNFENRLSNWIGNHRPLTVGILLGTSGILLKLYK